MFTGIIRKRSRMDKVENTEDVKPDLWNCSSSSGQATQIEEDEAFWFEDGTVILHAEDVEFRVYFGLLEGYSTVFKELFAQPLPTRAVSIAGCDNFPCPVVKLSDSPHDLRHLLRNCMPKQSGSIYDLDTMPSYDMISAAIRLGQKYNITHLSQKAVDVLKGYYTDSLDTWRSSIHAWCPSGWSEKQAIGVVNLARLTGELSLLPVALMVCAIRVDGDVVYGFTREDGSQEYLTLHDLSLCFRAKTRLREASVAALFRSLTPTPSHGCLAPHSCPNMLNNVLRRGNDMEAQVNFLMHSDVLLRTVDSYLRNKDGLTISFWVSQFRDGGDSLRLWVLPPPQSESKLPARLEGTSFTLSLARSQTVTRRQGSNLTLMTACGVLHMPR
ncbi:hypothetical protein GSI_10293 [Ganoderma sinense ZZ0214-1]|uniref:BTB domain-containing protein n=1 Tax=Ganoderma sinense ZZ0214-1 TaxID=1077348 RepID=A0A2G8S058_9APHY|nr:hypothetical protein GSI_10293 [Ganoderma sinense ZZ0214-1]